MADADSPAGQEEASVRAEMVGGAFIPSVANLHARVRVCARTCKRVRAFLCACACKWVCVQVWQ